MKTSSLLVLFLTGALAGPDAKKSPPLSNTKYSCYYDWDCDPGNCCSTIHNPGCLGYCMPCGQDTTEKIVKTGSKSISPKCIEDWDCQGGFCCSALQPGLEGDCVPCGGGRVAKKEENLSPKCIEDWDCQGGFCCSALHPGDYGDCVPCGGGLVAKPGRKSLLCSQHTECPDNFCCWQDSCTEMGVCVNCCI